ncbi:MAG: hypothetical protein K0S45_2999 [Nitrospira sp.]|jgi:hypothetical protein|nr:hypothetical protein [Nitrospira sp.]
MDDTEPSNTVGQTGSPQGPLPGSVQGAGRQYIPPVSLNQSPPGGQDKRFRLTLAIFWGAVLAAIIAALTAGYPGWQNYMAQEGAKRQLRAYIAVRTQGIATLEEGIKARVHDSFHNIGQTPAYDKGSSSHITVAEYPLSHTLVNDECSDAATSPKASKWFVGKISRPETVRELPFTAGEIEDIKAGKAAVYLHGRACYGDIFNESHQTDFCLYWKWDAGRLSPGLYCDQGNISD